MTTGLIILCRFNSQRLPGKIVREIRGRAVLGHIVDRLRRGAPDHPLVVATSSDPSDDPIAAYCRRSGLACFRGSLHDVAGRFLACAESQGWDFAVRINGDNVFADPDTLRCMLAVSETDAYDFITNVPGRTYPYGMSIEILRIAFYRQVVSRMQSADDREHVTGWLYQHADLGRRYVFENRHCPEARGLKLALDTEEDLARTTGLMARMEGAPGACGLAELARLATQPAVPSPWRGRHGPLLIAEIGGNHEGDYALACELVKQAAATGVDYVKFQLYRGDTLVSRVESPDRHAHFQRFELTRDQHLELARQCKQGGVGYLASVWDLEMLEWIDPFLDVYKIGSGDLTAWPVIREFARRGKPMIMATGLATLDEVLQTVRVVQAVDARYGRPEWLCLLQCTSMYPIPDREANLCAMDTLRAATGLAVGYSDHTEGGQALRVAAAMGAHVLEFHFTDRREGRTFRDHKVSLTPDEVLRLQQDLRHLAALRGDGVKVPQATEVAEGHGTSFRRAVYPLRDLPAGAVLAEGDLCVRRPNHGVDARDMETLVGRQLLRPVAAMHRLNRDMLKGEAE